MHENYLKHNPTYVKSLARKVNIEVHLLASVHVLWMSICDIEFRESQVAGIYKLIEPVMGLFLPLQQKSSESPNMPETITDLQTKLQVVTDVIGELSKQ